MWTAMSRTGSRRIGRQGKWGQGGHRSGTAAREGQGKEESGPVGQKGNVQERTEEARTILARVEEAVEAGTGKAWRCEEGIGSRGKECCG